MRHIAKILFCLALFALPAAAQSPGTGGDVILEIDGQVPLPQGESAIRFDQAMLEALGLSRITTSTVFTDGVHEFEGVLARDLLTSLGAEKATSVVARALNDYSIEIPVSDFFAYDVLLALRMDGKALTVRDKGPIWIVYPRDAFRELQNDRHDSRWVWQLYGLTVK